MMSAALNVAFRTAVESGRLNELARTTYLNLLLNRRNSTGGASGKLRQIHVVTASNQKFSEAAATLISSLASLERVARIICYDLGLSPDAAKALKSIDRRVDIQPALLPLVSLHYLQQYQFKIDGLMFAPAFLSDEELRDTAIIWVDSGILINGCLNRTIEILQRQDSFLCDLTTRKVAGGKPGTTVKAFNHLSPWAGEFEAYPFDSRILCQPLSWAGIHGYRYGSAYQRDVVEKAFEMSLSYPSLMSGPKFVSSEFRETMEKGPHFKAALQHAEALGLDLASRRWNGSRHDLFLFTCLYHASGRTLLSSNGIIEDLTDGQETKRTAAAEDVIEPRRSFQPIMLLDPQTEFVIHRGSLGLR